MSEETPVAQVGERESEAPQPEVIPPEERLLLAVVIQAVMDAPKPNRHGSTARAFLDDPTVQELTAALWGTATNSHILPADARRAIRVYRHTHGTKLAHSRHGHTVAWY